MCTHVATSLWSMPTQFSEQLNLTQDWSTVWRTFSRVAKKLTFAVLSMSRKAHRSSSRLHNVASFASIFIYSNRNPMQSELLVLLPVRPLTTNRKRRRVNVVDQRVARLLFCRQVVAKQVACRRGKTTKGQLRVDRNAGRFRLDFCAGRGAFGDEIDADNDVRQRRAETID